MFGIFNKIIVDQEYACLFTFLFIGSNSLSSSMMQTMAFRKRIDILIDFIYDNISILFINVLTQHPGLLSLTNSITSPSKINFPSYLCPEAGSIIICINILYQRIGTAGGI